MNRLLALLPLLVLASACAPTHTKSSAHSLPITVNEPDATVATNRVSGTLTFWEPGGPSIIEVILRNGTNTPSVLSSAPVKNGGRFTLDLPSAETMRPHLKDWFATSPNCNGRLVQSDPTARFFVIESFQIRGYIADASKRMFTRQNNPAFNDHNGIFQPGDYLIEWMYADKTTTVIGDRDCQSSQGGYTSTSVRLNLKAGWNATIMAPIVPQQNSRIIGFHYITPATMPNVIF